MEPNKILATFWREARINKKITQKEVADKMGYNAQFVSNWERGVCIPPIGSVSKLLKIVGASRKDYLDAHLENEKARVQSILSGRNKDV